MYCMSVYDACILIDWLVSGVTGTLHPATITLQPIKTYASTSKQTRHSRCLIIEQTVRALSIKSNSPHMLLGLKYALPGRPWHTFIGTAGWRLFHPFAVCFRSSTHIQLFRPFFSIQPKNYPSFTPSFIPPLIPITCCIRVYTNSF